MFFLHIQILFLGCIHTYIYMAKPALVKGRTYVLDGVLCTCVRALRQTRISSDDNPELRSYWEYIFQSKGGFPLTTIRLEEHSPGVFWLDGDSANPVAPPCVHVADGEVVAARRAARIRR